VISKPRKRGCLRAIGLPSLEKVMWARIEANLAHLARYVEIFSVILRFSKYM
jgi:hypothetical protein